MACTLCLKPHDTGLSHTLCYTGVFPKALRKSYIADIVVEDSIILELKSQDAITNANRAQTLNYLKATGYKLAIILNFGKTMLQSERLAN
jgi:GxxExxY protein